MADWRKEWFDFEGATYLDVAAQGPLPRVAVKAALQALEWKKFPHIMPVSTYTDLPDSIRASLAKLIGGDASEIAITTGASAGMAAVAAGLDWQPTDEVLIARGEFPAHFTTWLPMQAAGKLKVVVVEPHERFICADDFIARIGPHTRLVSTSLVRFDNGARMDAARLSRACHEAGALLLLDGAQCVGAMPVNVRDLGADFLTVSGYKWLLSPYGTGFFWARSDLIERMRLGPFYYQAVENPGEFHALAGETFRVAKGARRWDSPETGNFLNLAPMAASLELLLRAGVETVWEHARYLTAMMIERLPLDRVTLASPADPGQRGPYACIVARKPAKTPEMFERLQAANVTVSLREGALRVSPYLYNSEGDIDRLLSVLTV